MNAPCSIARSQPPAGIGKRGGEAVEDGVIKVYGFEGRGGRPTVLAGREAKGQPRV